MSTALLGHRLRCRDEHDLVGAADGELEPAARDAGAEVEQHDVVEGAEQSDQLAVGIRAEPGHDLGVGGGAEQVQSARERGHVGAQLGGGLDLLDVSEQIGERPSAAQPVGRQRREGAEVGVGVDGDHAQPQTVGEQAADHEGAASSCPRRPWARSPRRRSRG